ncbi:phage tail protein I, partial [Endozoicomonas sp. SM1973]
MSLLPSNASPLEQALSDNTQRFSDIPAYPNSVWNPDTCSDNCLPWLAWALSVDEWDEAWEEQTKRNVIKASIEVHRHKGTLGAVKKALAATGVDITVTEWFEYNGQPYTFKADVNLETRGLTEKEYENINRLIKQTKNVRSHFDLTIYLTNKAKVPRLATSCQQGQQTTVIPHLTKQIDSQFCSCLTSGYQTVAKHTVLPKITTHLESQLCRFAASGFQSINILTIRPKGA